MRIINNHDDGESHGEIDNATCGTDTLDHAEPDEEPHEGAPANSFAHKSRLRVAHIVRGSGSWDRVRVCNDIDHVEIATAPCPGKRTLERAAEIVHGPGKNWDIVSGDNVTGHDDCETQALGTFVDAIIRDDHAASVGLSESDFENEDWDTKAGEGDEVGDEPLQSIVCEDDGGITEEVTQSNGTALQERC